MSIYTHGGESDPRRDGCDSCQDLRAEVDRLTAENERLKAALIKIRDADYRGNRSPESRMAYDALKGQP